MKGEVSMADMSFVDISLDTKNAGIQAEVRKLISLDTAVLIVKEKKTLSVAAEDSDYPS